MTSFSADWIEDYAVKTAPLREIMKQAGLQHFSNPLKWNTDALLAFETLKKELQQAPALGNPEYSKQFHLYIANRADGYASAVLMQETYSGRKKQPIAYYSTKLDNVAQGYPPCYQQGPAAIYYACEKASTITMGYPVTIYTHHKIVELIEQGKFVLTQARILAYSSLLTYPDVTIKQCHTVNPAELIPLAFEGKLHDCVTNSLTFTRLRLDLESTPIPDTEVTYFVDSSSFRDHVGNHTGYSVVKDIKLFVPVITQHCVQPCSAQLAELKALTVACQLAKGHTANIFTDLAYAHGVCHLFGAVWKQRGFKKSDGTPILHSEQICQFIFAMMLPKRLAIIKCQAHKKRNDFVIKGNNAADLEAKKASGCQVTVLSPVVLIEPQPQLDDIIQIQQQAGPYEHSMWHQRGSKKDTQDLWRTHEGQIVAPIFSFQMRMVLTIVQEGK